MFPILLLPVILARPLSNIAISVSPLTDNEKLELKSMLKALGLSKNFLLIVLEYFNKSKFTYQNFEEFSKVYPEVSNTVQKNLRLKIQNTTDVNKNKESSDSIEFINYKSGAKFFKSLLESYMLMQTLNFSLMASISNMFESTVGSDGTFTKNFHTKTNSIKDFQIKSPKDNEESGYEVIYFEMHMSSKVKKGFFIDTSNTEIKTIIKVRNFHSINELIQWTSTT